MDWYSYTLGILTTPIAIAVLGGIYLLNELALERRRRLAERRVRVEEPAASAASAPELLDRA